MPAIEITPAPRPAKSYGVSLTPGACSAVQSFTAAAIAGELEPSRTLTFKRIWDCLPVAERREACVSVFASSADPHTVMHRKALTETLVRFFRFRPSFFARKSDWEKASHLIDVMNDRTFPANDLPLRSWLLTHHNGMIREFLDELGMAHRGGIISYEPAPPTPPSVALLRKAVLTIVRKYPPLPVGVYLAFISYQSGDDIFMNVAEALREEQIDLDVLLGIKEAPLPEAVEARSPDSEFTTLDRLLLSTIDAAACGAQGALNHSQLEDLVEETIELSAARPRSLYHRGLMHALLGRPLEFQFPGADEPRRLWYFTGALAGLLRSGDAGPALALMAGQHALAARLMSVQGAACGTLLLPGMHAALVRAGKAALACGWARAQVQSFPLHERPAIIASFQDLGEEQLARGGLAEATLLLEFVRDNVSARGACPPEFARSLRSRNARTLAQVLQARGRFDQATAMLRELVSSRDDAAAAGALADLGLVHAGFRSVTAALPRSQEEANIPLAKSLEKGRASFEESIARCPGASAVAHVCLGMSAFVAQPPQPAAAADHLREALQVLVRDEPQEGPEGPAGEVVRWTRFCLAISLLETLDSSALQRAGDLLEHAMESPSAYPDYLWSRTLQAAALFDDQSLAERICERLIQRNDSRAFALLGSTGLYRRSAPLRAMYQGWLGRAPLAAHKRWQQTRALLTAAVEHADLPVAEQALDALEGLAMELPAQRRELIAMLDSPESYSPAWSPDDADAARMRLLELDGEYAAAAQALLRRFHKARSAGGEHHLAYARDLLEVIDGYKLKDLDTAPLHRLVTDARPLALSGDPLEPLRRGAKARVLYIGGNEKQRASEAALLEAFAAEYPGLEVTFMFPGFSSNWRSYVEEVERMLPGVDAVCLSFLVRTTFGRHVRALCSSAHPWFPCTGGGKQCIRRSIERAALWAVTRPVAAAA
jgi:hypothetical protein